jgi:hypothetical protein
MIASCTALGALAAPPDPTELNAKLKACAYRYTPTGDPCIDNDARDIMIEGGRIVFVERHEYTPYTGGPACRNYDVERQDQAALSDLVPEVVADKRRKALWLTLGCNSGRECVDNTKALRSGKPIEREKVSPGPTQTKITTAIQCKDPKESAALAAELKGFIAASQQK